MKKIKKDEQMIHIKAESEFLRVSELIPANKTIRRLMDIRDNFSYMKKRFDPNGKQRLVVKTCVHNPTLF